MGTRDVIYTLGTGTRSLDVFLSILDAYGIQTIADVRRWPRSRRHPHFSRDCLEGVARAKGLNYHWFGDLLGGYRKGGYEAYKEEASYQEGLARLEDLARKSSVAMVCAERFAWKCHRMHISRSLTERGWEVIHVIEEVRTWQPKEQGRLEWGRDGEMQ